MPLSLQLHTARLDLLRSTHAAGAALTRAAVHPRKAKMDMIRWKREGGPPPLPPMGQITAALGPVEPDQPRWQAGAPPGEIQHTWIGHATFLLQLNGLNILTDPQFSARCSPVSFIGPKRVLPPASTVEQLPRIDAVLISHNHYDHLDHSTVQTLASRPGGDRTIWFVPHGLKAWFTNENIQQVVELQWWEEAELGGGRLRCMFTPAKHWTKRGLMDDMTSLWGSWAVYQPGSAAGEPAPLSVWFSGDTGKATPCGPRDSVFEVCSRRREFCHSAAAPSTFSRSVNRDGEGASAK